MTDEAPPQATGKPPETVSLTGRLIPAQDATNPVLLRMPGSERLYLPCFADEDEMQTVLGRAGVEYAGIKQIDDEMTFLDSLPPEVTVITNLWWTEEGKIRFHQVTED